jgi:outer membrane immunogenic protein
MSRFGVIGSLSLMIAVAASPSLAADLTPPPSYKARPPAYVVPFSWSGFYVGINGGYGFGSSKWSNTGSDTFGVNGGLVGVTLGYNWQGGNWVYGLEGDIDASWFKDSSSNPAGGGVCGGIAGCETNVPWIATARGRVGYAGWSHWMPYITGGAAFANIEATPNGGSSVSSTNIGWTAGAGIEYAFLENWSAKLEYLYADLGSLSCSATNCGIDTKVDFKTGIVRVGLNYRF